MAGGSSYLVTAWRLLRFDPRRNLGPDLGLSLRNAERLI